MKLKWTKINHFSGDYHFYWVLAEDATENMWASYWQMSDGTCLPTHYHKHPIKADEVKDFCERYARRKIKKRIAELEKLLEYEPN